MPKKELDAFEQKRAARQKKIRKRRAKAFLVFFLIFLIVLGLVLSLTVLFPITNISTKGSNIYSNEEIIKASGLKIDDNTFAFLSKKTEEKIRAKLPYIKSVDVDRSFSGKIVLTVKDAKPDYCVKVENSYYLLGNDNFVLEKVNNPPADLMLLIFKSGAICKTGQYLNITNEDLKEAANKISEALNENNIKINYLDLTDKLSVIAKVENRFEVNFGTMNDIDKKINHLNGMINKIEKDKTGKINLSIWSKSNPEGTFVEYLPE